VIALVGDSKEPSLKKKGKNRPQLASIERQQPGTENNFIKRVCVSLAVQNLDVGERGEDFLTTQRRERSTRERGGKVGCVAPRNSSADEVRRNGGAAR